MQSQDSCLQVKWTKNELNQASPNVKNGYDTKARRNALKPIFDQCGVNVYITVLGHSLQHLAAAGCRTKHFITGAASESTAVRQTAQSKMAAADDGFMLFSIQEKSLLIQTVLIQTVIDTGRTIHAARIDK